MKTETIGRREALARAAAAAAALGLSASRTQVARAQSRDEDTQADHELLNALLTAEYDGVATYAAGMDIVAMDPNETRRETVLAVAGHFQEQHRQHARALTELISRAGGAPVEDSRVAALPDSFDAESASTEDVLRLTADKEKQAAITYVDVLRNLNTTVAAELVASIGAVETQHFVVLYLLAEGLVVPTAATREMASLVVPAAFVLGTGTDTAVSLDDLPALEMALAFEPPAQ